MKKHTKIYLDYFDYGYHTDVFIPCEICGNRAVDIHHLDPRGMGGSKHMDFIENLMGLCRSHHLQAEANPNFNEICKTKHLKFMYSGQVQND